jgi:hypothetical protein
MTSQTYSERLNRPDQVVRLQVEEDKLVSGPRTITVQQGQSVNIEIRAIAEEVRVKLDGYNIITENHPSDNVPGGFNFVADKKGTFHYYALPDKEDHNTQNPVPKLLGTIIVQ